MQPNTDKRAPGSHGFILLGDAAVSEGSEQPSSSAELGGASENDEALEPEIEVPQRVLELERLFTELEPVASEQVVLTLTGSAAARLAGRAAFLGMIGAEAAAAAAQERDWQALLGAGLSAAQLALLVRAEPWLPPSHHGVSFCRWLVSEGLLEQEQLDELFERSIQLGWPIFQVALEQEVLDEEAYIRHLARFTNHELAEAPGRLPRSLLVAFPMGWVEHFDLVPLERERGRVLIAAPKPLPKLLLDRLAADTGEPVEVRLAAPADVAAWRRRWLRHWWRVHHAGRQALADS